MRILLILVLLVTLASGGVNTPVAAASELGNPFQSYSGACGANPSDDDAEPAVVVKGRPVSEPHTAVVARLSVATGKGTWWGDAVRTYSDFGSGDVLFRFDGALERNDTPSTEVHCEGSDVSFTVDLFDAPSAPTAFSGQMRYQDKSLGGGDVVSRLPFIAPGSATYVADVTLSQGSVEVCLQDCTKLASSSVVSLGRVGSGGHTLMLSPLDGPPAGYTVAIRPLAVAIRGLTFSPSALNDGTIGTASYNTDGDTTITAGVFNAAGAEVNTLASSLAVEAGGHTLTWDGRDDSGSKLSPGDYTLRITSTDRSGLTSDAATTVTLAEPLLTFPSACGRPRVKPRSFDYRCGPASRYGYVRKVTWRGWGSAVARGRGLNYLNNCKPYCARGRYVAHRARVRLSRVRDCSSSRRQYTLLTVFDPRSGRRHGLKVRFACDGTASIPGLTTSR